MNYDVLQSAEFRRWHQSLSDLPAKLAIGRRIERVSLGNLGDFKSIGGGLSELRIDVSSGYRVYFIKRHLRVIILLAGGDKSSQSSDIQRARLLAKEVAK
ncbi:type II toxin-antitoxin system RelE/ParE family toxin [Pseudomonas sp. BP8]|uniref:type II toxin-antitoxin system RelE/ParE family toxin n=1 Tax=Pseudomonas sp. BP8 TaxID=2817864 RepID=UPI001AE52973|nr:putative addiction module killer protein [Pseudomonas sp. BP8]HDS1736094.1 type II toxin-antitoxin system RelE/ParE family toxin [Pseudomonas putida]